MQTSDQMTYQVYLLFSHQHQSHPLVLMKPGQNGWQLPSVEITLPRGDNWWREVAAIDQAIQQTYTLNATTLSCVHAGTYLQTGQPFGLFAIENHDADSRLPSDYVWIGQDSFDSLSLAVTELRPALEHWLGYDEGWNPGSRLRWAQPGWFEAAAEWMQKLLKAHDLTPTGPVEQVRSWFLSCILRVNTNAGGFMLKAAPDMYAYEPQLTQQLARAYPAMVPRVLAVEPISHWMLMEEIQGIKLNKHPDKARYLPRWEVLLREFARMQHDLVERASVFSIALPCPSWDLEYLAEDVIPYVLIDPLHEQLPAILAAGFSEEERAQLRALAPRLEEICTELQQDGLPPTLVHGDFHSGNIIANDQECKLIDWAGFVSVTHPFLLLSVVFEEHRDPLIRQRLLDVYLDCWTDYAPIERLRASAKLAEPLGWLYGALGHLNEWNHAETPWDRAQEQGNLIYCLKMLLKHMHQ